MIKSSLSIATCLVAIAFLTACASTTQPSNIAILFTTDTFGYTKLCGCCANQFGGLERRATYLYELNNLIAGKQEIIERQAEQDAGKADTTAKGDDAGAGGVSPVDIDGSGTAESGKERKPLWNDDPMKTMVKDDPDPSEIPDDFLLVDCGSFSDNATISDLIQSKYTCKSLEMMCYDAVNIGSREANLPQDELLMLLEVFETVPVVSANVRFTTPESGEDCSEALKALIKPYATVDIAGKRFFITGVSGQKESMHGVLDQYGIDTEDPAGSVEAVLNNARPSDYVIVLTSSLNKDETSALIELDRINALIGTDKVVLDGLELDPARIDGRVLNKSLDRGRTICRGNLLNQDDGSMKLVASSASKIHKSMEKHTMITDLLKDMEVEITDEHIRMQKEMANVDPGTRIGYIGKDRCGACHAEVMESFLLTRHASAIDSLVEKQENRNGMCLPCHTTGYNEYLGYSIESPRQELCSVTCEECHGPGQAHYQLMNGNAVTGPTEGLNAFMLRDVTVETCTQCHVETTDPEFSFDHKVKLVDHTEQPQGE